MRHQKLMCYLYSHLSAARENSHVEVQKGCFVAENESWSISPLKKCPVIANTITAGALASSPSIPQVDDPFTINFNDYVTEIARRQKQVDRTELGGEDIMESLDVTKGHFQRRD